MIGFVNRLFSKKTYIYFVAYAFNSTNGLPGRGHCTVTRETQWDAKSQQTVAKSIAEVNASFEADTVTITFFTEVAAAKEPT